MKSLFYSFKQVKAIFWILFVAIIAGVIDFTISTVLNVFMQFSALFTEATNFYDLEGAVQTINPGTVIILVAYVIIAIILSSVVKSFFEAVKIGATKQAVNGEKIDFDILISYGKKHFLSFFIASIVYGIVYIVIMIGIAAGFVMDNQVFGFSMIALMIAFMIVAMFSFYAMVYDEVGFIKGFKRSLKMSLKGSFDGLLGALFLVLITVLIYAPILLLFMTNEVGFVVLGIIIGIIVSIVFLAILYPVTYIWIMKLYKESTEKKLS